MPMAIVAIASGDYTCGNTDSGHRVDPNFGPFPDHPSTQLTVVRRLLA